MGPTIARRNSTIPTALRHTAGSSSSIGSGTSSPNPRWRNSATTSTSAASRTGANDRGRSFFLELLFPLRQILRCLLEILKQRVDARGAAMHFGGEGDDLLRRRALLGEAPQLVVVLFDFLFDRDDLVFD